MNTDRFKFRIWHDCQGMIYPDGVYIRVSEDKVMKLDRSVEEPRYFIMPLQDYDILQCTGLKDSEGKLIYEGDLVQEKSNTITYEVKFDSVGWLKYILYDASTSGYSILDSFKQYKIVGNIYELQD